MNVMLNVKLLGISGSPRHGNTDILVKEALKSSEELAGVSTQFISLADLTIKGGCTNCWECLSEPSWENLCRGYKDDCNKIFRAWIESDGIIVGTPVYYNGPTAQLKQVMDRTMALETLGFPVRNKVAGVIAVGYDRNGGQEATIQELHRWLLMLDLIIVGVGPERPGIGTGSYLGAAAVQGFPRPKAALEPGEETAVLEDEVGLTACRFLGKRVAEISRVVKKGFQSATNEELYWPAGAAAEAIGFLPPSTND
jgi:multimeric flavodoxin WrbA